jgi:hypothetical protein
MIGMASDFAKPRKDYRIERETNAANERLISGLEQSSARDEVCRFCIITKTTYIMYHTTSPANRIRTIAESRHLLAGLVTT